MGKGISTGGGADSNNAYLQLPDTTLASTCHIPTITSPEEMVSKLPLLMEVMVESCSSMLDECYEVLCLVSSATENGAITFYECGGMKLLSSQMSAFPDGSHSMELAVKLVQLMLGKVTLDVVSHEYPSELSVMVAIMARQFAVLNDALKFDVLHILSAIFSSKYSGQVYNALKLMPDDAWLSYMRVGMVAILQNRVAPADKLQALILADSIVSLVGERWLIDQKNLPDIQDHVPADTCLLLVLESSRVEVAVLLNELAYLKYEASKISPNVEGLQLKKGNLAIAYSLLEKIIKLISNLGENEGDLIDESTLTNVIAGLNETIDLVLEYLRDAKEHKQNRGDDLLASVRIVGSYLAEAPLACKEKIKELLGFMLSIEGEDEPSPFYSICFLLPMLCQMTMRIEGCEALASCGQHKAIIDCLFKMVGPNRHMVDENSCIFLACDTIMNLLLKREQIQFSIDESAIVYILTALAHWAEDTSDLSILMMASSICALIFDHTSEEALIGHRDFNSDTLNGLSRIIGRSLATRALGSSYEAKDNVDLFEIIMSGFSRWASKFPSITQATEG